MKIIDINKHKHSIIIWSSGWWWLNIQQGSRARGRRASQQGSLVCSRQSGLVRSRQGNLVRSRRAIRQSNFSEQPTRQPIKQPLGHPTERPSSQPTDNPTSLPSEHPTEQPSQQPTVLPSVAPTLVSYVSASSEAVPALNWSAIALNTHAGRGVKTKYAAATQAHGGINSSQSPVTLKWSLSSRQAVSWKSVVLSYSGQYQLAGSAGGLCGQSADCGDSWNISTVCTASTAAAIRYVTMDGSGQYRLASTYADHVLDDDNFTLAAVTTVYLMVQLGS